MDGWLVTMLGTFAGLCTTGGFVPQALKAWREGDTSLLLGGFILALKLRAGDDQHQAGEAPGAAR